MRRPRHEPNSLLRALLLAPATLAAVFVAAPSGALAAETLASIGARLGRETSEAYSASPFSSLSRDCFLRFTRDPDARAGSDEVEIGTDWRIVLPEDADPLADLMAGHLADFLAGRMSLPLATVRTPRNALASAAYVEPNAIVLLDAGGGADGAPESFALTVAPGGVVVAGADARGLRDGVAELVWRMGNREAPFLARGEETFRPRLPVRLGAIPSMGSMKDLVFLGYNAMFAGGGDLGALSTSDAIPELAARRVPGLLESGAKAVAEAGRYGLKTFAFFDTRQKFPENDPVLLAHPEIRGARTWSADGEFVLCTEHPLVRRYLSESVEGVFRACEGLSGACVIIGGEGFYHCFMRPHGVKKGHTNCARCEALGPDRVVSNLCNLLAESARRANPEAVVAVWPYSAEHVWSAEIDQAGFLRLLEPGVALLTEIEKGEYLEKPGGVRKHLWDYSIDLIGPGARAKSQLAICAERGIPVFLKSEPEFGFEAPRLPHVPCMGRWADRAEALASCGATGAFVFPAFRPLYGTSAAEINRAFWWSREGETENAQRRDAVLDRLARRIAGPKAASLVREAWRAADEAVEQVPEIPPYYFGPLYLGPAQPMIVDPDAEVPQVFYGYYLFMAEMNDAEGMRKRPTFATKAGGNPPVFLEYHRRKEAALKRASDAMIAVRPDVDARRLPMFEAEDSPVQWFYRTARTEANFQESCILRDRILAREKARKERGEAVGADPSAGEPTAEEKADDARDRARWLEVLEDERENARAALPIMEGDVRLDFRYGGDHTFERGADMIRAKLELLEAEIESVRRALAGVPGN